MPRPRGIGRDGLPVDLIGKALEYRLAPIPRPGVGIRVIGQQETSGMADNTAKSDGIYTLDGGRFVVRAGDTLPAGAKFEAVDDVFAPNDAEFSAEEAEIVEGTKAQPVVERSMAAAPENKSRKAAPETKSL
ncbi:MAG: hypothetical protein M3Q75_01560 [Gemmatimonadota bacterium]|nr:hypothetical protein [Gemmatimonadota bacterium]